MANVGLIPLSGSCDDLQSFSHAVEIPMRVDCSPGCRDKILVESGEVWNCKNPREGQIYYNPLKAGDTPHVQTQFVDDYNADPENPISGLGSYIVVSLCQLDGTVVSTDHTTFFSKYYVWHDGEKSIQQYEISTDLIIANYPALTCFNFKFEVYNDTPEIIDTLESNHFTIDADDCNDLTLIVESVGNSDCCDSVYSMPSGGVGNTPFRYSNAWRFYLELKRINTQFSKTRFSATKATRNDLDKIFRLRMTKPMPPYLFAYWSEISLGGERVYIGGVEYYIDEFDFPNEFDTSCDFIGSVEVYQPCSTNYKCS